MINIKILQELNKLSALYEKRWGKKVDYIGMPSNISQERLLLVLRYIVDTGDSVLVGFQKVRNITLKYLDYIEREHESHAWDVENGYVFTKPCPLCGEKVKYFEFGNSYSYTCSTENCFNATCRGI